MQIKSLKKWKSQLETLNPPIRTCKICFKRLSNPNFYTYLHKEPCLCDECLNSLKTTFFEGNIYGYNYVSIYEYNDTIKSLLYQFKGCYDYELKDVFISRFVPVLKFKYKGYYLVPAPSFYLDDESRGFNHVTSMFACLGLPFLNLIEKTSKYKQSDHTGKDRANIINHLRLKQYKKLFDKKILIVDDVFTTGSTIKSIIKLIKPLKPKSIKILTMCKVKFIDIMD